MPYADIEQITINWARQNNSLWPLVFANNRVHIYQSMPTASPIPSMIIQRVGGAPTGRGNMPLDSARLSFDCWGKSRAEAYQTSTNLVSELDCLGPTGGYIDPSGVRLETAVVVLWSWNPDIRTDAARYVVDATIWALVPAE